jgi:hypothetical protein
LALFEAHERAALLPLPVEPFELRETRSVKVHPDCHVVIDGSYYSVPHAQVCVRYSGLAHFDAREWPTRDGVTTFPSLREASVSSRPRIDRAQPGRVDRA